MLLWSRAAPATGGGVGHRVEQLTRRTRIADVAREAGVSKTAVSFAFNSPDRLSPETATRIREVAESVGYRLHPVARMLTQGQTMALGVLTPQALSVIFSNPFFGAFNEGVALAAEEHGYGLHFISPVHGSLARAIGRATVDGVVAIGLSEHHPDVEQIRHALPIVLVDSTAMPDHPSIDIDDEGGARAAAEQQRAEGGDEDGLDDEAAQQQHWDRRHGQAGQSQGQRPGRLLALQHERRREDRVRQEDHRQQPLEADRHVHRQLDDPRQGDADGREDDQCIDEEQADAAGHRHDRADHGPEL